MAIPAWGDAPVMLYVLIILWTIMGALLVMDPKSTAIRWLSGVVFCGGSGALAVVISTRVIPYANEQAAGEALGSLLFTIQMGASLTSYYGLPYAFLMFALHYRRIVFPGLWSAAVPFLLLVPVIISLWFTPEYSEEYPVHFRGIIWWVAAYISVGTVLILSRKEWNRTERHIHWMTCLAVLPAVLFSAVMNYVLPSFGFYQMWKYNIWIIIFGFIVFLIAIFTYGFMGIRIMIQKRQLDSALRAITSGTAILNHAIKNDVGKILLFSEKMKRYAIKTEQRVWIEDIDIIMESANHIQEMIRRVHHQSQGLILKTEVTDLGLLADQVLKSVEPRMAEQGITIERDYSTGVMMNCDRVQLFEALTNVVVNAQEAMPAGGLLILRIRESKKRIEIQISDSGAGISKKELSMVLEPFFTTKTARNHNFGLGLAYCYQVVKHHGGTLDIRSIEGQGTTVTFRFPVKTMVH